MFNTKQELSADRDTKKLTSCPSCGTSIETSRLLFHSSMLGNNCRVVKCDLCSLIYKELVPTASGLAQIYTGEYVHFQSATQAIDLAKLNSAQQKLQKCQKMLPNNQQIKVLDVGCGSGEFVEMARKLGYQAAGVDPYLPDRLQSNYLFKQSPETIPDCSYDIATLLNVAEHLDRPEAMFAAIYKLLKPNGVMLLTCPYGNSWARRIYQHQWNHLVLDEHLLFWTPKSLTYLLRQIGFQGKISYRISGSPFPQGKVTKTSNSNAASKQQANDLIPLQQKPPSLNSRIWQIGKAIQRQPTTANFVRQIIHLGHLGDYLEYVICK